MKLAYLYDAPLPSPLTAWIQILKTCRALCDLGVEVEIIAGEMTGSVPACLEFFGVDAHSNLVIREWRKFPSPPPNLRADWVVSRDDRGITLFKREFPPGSDGRHPRIALESHRICFLNRSEKMIKVWRMPRMITPGGRLTALLGGISSGKVRRLRRQESLVVRRADAIIAVSRGVGRDIERYFSAGRPTLVLPSGADVPGERPPLQGRDLDIVYAGKLLKRKGLGDLLRAMRHLPGRRLTIVGGSDEEVAAFRAVAERFGVASRVDFLGFTEPSRVGELLRRARVGVCPMAAGVSSITERYTSPMKIVEAWAAGTPLVAGATEAVLDAVTPDHDALVYPPGNPSALAGAVRRLLEDSVCAESVAAAGFASARARSWPVRAARLKEFLESLAGDSTDGNPGR